ncbi:MAG: radical SAM/SPASM domain-containing protein [Nitrospinaceae bacterium]
MPDFTSLKPTDFPERVTVELTPICNLSCVMCPRHELGDGGYMDAGLFKKIIDEMAGHPGVALVPFFRGESLMHPRFFELMRYAKEKNISPIQLTSNATILTEKIALQILDLGIDFLSFSLDSNDSEAYRAVRGFDLDRVRQNVERFLELKKSMGLELPRVQVSAVETEPARKHIEEFVAYWKDRADRVRIYTEHSRDGVYGRLDQAPEEFPHRLPCKKPMNEMVIYWDGQVALCNHDWNRKEFLGDVGKQSIQEVWEGAPYQEVRARHLENRCGQDPTCKGCDHWKVSYLKSGMMGRLYEKEAPVSPVS